MSTITPASQPPSSSKKTKTRILIISDTHTGTPHPFNSPHVFRSPLPKADILLHCGDLTEVGKLWEYERTLEMLGSIDAGLKLVIAGNHDVSLDESFFERRGWKMHGLKEKDVEMREEVVRKAKDLWMGEAARKAGVTYLEEGTREFVLGNGGKFRIYTSPYQPEFCNWAFPYTRTQDRFNPPSQTPPSSKIQNIAENPIPDFPAIDILMTHGPPQGIGDELYDGRHAGCAALLRASARCRPKLHCFGHIHEGWGAEIVGWKDSDSEEGGGSLKLEGYIERREKVEVDEGRMMEERAVRVDVSDGGRKLEWGKETLMVNASIMTQKYELEQGAWLVDLDLDGA